MKALISTVFLTFAFTLNDPSFAFRGATLSQQEAITEAYNLLPMCERKVIDQRVEFVDIIPDSLLHGDWGESNETTKTIRIVQSLDGETLKRIFLHEAGHFFDQGRSNRSDFHASVRGDFSKLPAEIAFEDAYLSRDCEAFAELFSAHFLPTYRSTIGAYHVDMFPRTTTDLSTILSESCGDE